MTSSIKKVYTSEKHSHKKKRHDDDDDEKGKGAVCEKKEKEFSVPDDTETETETETEEEEETEDEEEDAVSFSTTDILANDPLYFVLSKILMTEDGKNIATILEEINTKLSKIKV